WAGASKHALSAIFSSPIRVEDFKTSCQSLRPHQSSHLPTFFSALRVSDVSRAFVVGRYATFSLDVCINIPARHTTRRRTPPDAACIEIAKWPVAPLN